jgi:hypothetical protein
MLLSFTVDCKNYAVNDGFAWTYMNGPVRPLEIEKINMVLGLQMGFQFLLRHKSLPLSAGGILLNLPKVSIAMQGYSVTNRVIPLAKQISNGKFRSVHKERLLTSHH